MKNSNRGTQKGEDKRKAFTEENLNKYLNSTGMAKTKAKGKLLYGYCLYPKFKFDYVGGHPSHPQKWDNCSITILPQGLIMSATDDLIEKSEIKSVDIKTEEEISRDVTLTRLLAFGIYAFALKKEKRSTTKYVVLNCEKNGFKYSMAFAGNGVNSFYKELYNLMAG